MMCMLLDLRNSCPGRRRHDTHALEKQDRIFLSPKTKGVVHRKGEES